jgi:excisionase family DNA binding protein
MAQGRYQWGPSNNGEMPDCTELVETSCPNAEQSALSRDDASITDDPWLLTPDQVAAKLNVSRSKVFQLLQDDLPSVQIGRSRRVPAERLREWVAQRETLR